MEEYEVGDRIDLEQDFFDTRMSIKVSRGAVLTLIDGPFEEGRNIVWVALSPGGILISVPQELFANEFSNQESPLCRAW
tara:strand:- start:328 stop:564 length:237 start_codon:yes stop_codon:yes gene_type:complete